jgi:hypothetical protein
MFTKLTRMIGITNAMQRNNGLLWISISNTILG